MLICRRRKKSLAAAALMSEGLQRERVAQLLCNIGSEHCPLGLQVLLQQVTGLAHHLRDLLHNSVQVVGDERRAANSYPIALHAWSEHSINHTACFLQISRSVGRQVSPGKHLSFLPLQRQAAVLLDSSGKSLQCSKDYVWRTQQVPVIIPIDTCSPLSCSTPSHPCAIQHRRLHHSKGTPGSDHHQPLPTTCHLSPVL